MPLSVARRVHLAAQPFKVTIAWHPRPGIVTAWDSARTAYGMKGAKFSPRPSPTTL